mgnify:CR=1 FL=1
MTLESKIYSFLNKLDENDYHAQYDVISYTVDPFLAAVSNKNEKTEILKMLDGINTHKNFDDIMEELDNKFKTWNRKTILRLIEILVQNKK